MGGALAVALNQQIDAFEKENPEYHIVNDFKGDYPTLLTSLVAAYRAGEQPAIAQVYEIGTALMMSEREAIIPVQTLMQEYGYPISVSEFLPAIGYYYADDHGRLMSLPFNSSSPVLFYNLNEFKKAGLTAHDVPTSWPQVEVVGKKLAKAGVHCALTTAWPAWIQLEEFSAWHNLPYATGNNGFSRFDVKVLYNNPAVIRQVRYLAHLQKMNLFQYGGRGDSAKSLFTSGRCAMLMESSGSRGSLVGNVNFDVGVSAIPYWPDIKGAPQNTIIGGASLWVMKGHSKAVYKGVVKFFHFLLKPSSQLAFQKATGYLPLTKKGFQYAKQKGFYEKTPGAIVAIEELNNKPPSNYSKGIRLGNFPQIRDANNNALESVFSGQATATEAMSKAAKQANALIARFAEMARK